MKEETVAFGSTRFTVATVEFVKVRNQRQLYASHLNMYL